MKLDLPVQKWRVDGLPGARILLLLCGVAGAIFAVIKWRLWIWVLIAIGLVLVAITTPIEHRINNKVTVWPIQRLASGELDLLEPLEEKTYRAIPERQEVIEMGDLGLIRLEGCIVADRLNWQCPQRPEGGNRALKMLDGILAESQSDDDPDASFSLIATRFECRVCPGETRYVSLWRWLWVHRETRLHSSPADSAECSAPISKSRSTNGIDTQY
jgi:hypothetical protein